jgi:hypothetical protein
MRTLAYKPRTGNISYFLDLKFSLDIEKRTHCLVMAFGTFSGTKRAISSRWVSENNAVYF